MASSFLYEASFHDYAIHHLRRQGRAKTQQRFGIVCGFDFQSRVRSFRSLFKPDVFRPRDCVRNVIRGIPAETDCDCLGGIVNDIKRDLVSFKFGGKSFLLLAKGSRSRFKLDPGASAILTHPEVWNACQTPCSAICAVPAVRQLVKFEPGPKNALFLAFQAMIGFSERFFGQPIGPDTAIVAVRFRVVERL